MYSDRDRQTGTDTETWRQKREGGGDKSQLHRGTQQSQLPRDRQDRGRHRKTDSYRE